MLKQFNYQIVEVANIESDGPNWVATSSDPYFIIRVEGSPSDGSAEIVRMTAVVLTQHERVNGKLYLPVHGHYSESTAIKRSFPNGKLQEYLIPLEQISGDLRFDPHNLPGAFSMEGLSFYSWSSGASKTSILFDIANRKWDPRLPQRSSLHELRQQAGFDRPITELLTEYISGQDEYVEDPYALWIKYVEGANQLKLSREKWKPKEQGEDATVRFSLVVPVYNTDPLALRECIQSVKAQTYENWELCIADDASTNQATILALKEEAESCDKIRVKWREQNGHICKTTNDAIGMASGDYICFLDHDDELAPFALERLAKEIANHPNACLIYSDEDFTDLSGNRTSPHFKSDWNPELLLGHNYITHFSCIKGSVVEQLGGLREGYEGSQDYDMMLRVSEVLKTEDIRHIPEVLYHWRISEGSTASSSDAKPYTVEKGRLALESHIERTGKRAIVEDLPLPNFYRVKWLLPNESEPHVTIIIPTRNGHDLLNTCITSILDKTEYNNYEVVIVNNQSDDPLTLKLFDELKEKDSRIRVLDYPHAFNYSAINNFAVHQTSGELICLLNNDTEVINKDWLTELASQAMREEIGCVGGKLYYEDDTIQHAGIIVSLGGVAGHSHKGYHRSSPGYFHRLGLTQQVSAVTGACLMVRRTVYEQVNGLDEERFVVAYNDVDFCLKVDALGLRNLYTPFAQLYHYESKSRGYEDTPEKLERFNREKGLLLDEWGHRLSRDPYYNDNLTRDREDFSIRVPAGHH
jgi:glycosyltransferase involved in cell wall biosynthesis